MWPVWKEKILENQLNPVWWATGRRRADSIVPGIPVVVLGTNGLGVVALGETSSKVCCIPDPDWPEVSDDFKEECRAAMNRVQVMLRRASIALSELHARPMVANLYLRREKATWITAAQYDILNQLT